MTYRTPTSVFFASLALISVSACEGKDGEGATSAADPTLVKVEAPKLPPVFNNAAAKFAPISGLAPIVDGAKISAVETGGYRISASKTVRGYQAGAMISSEGVDRLVVRYEIGPTTEPGTIGILAGDGSHWLASSTFGPGGPSTGELTTDVAEKAVRLILETDSAAKPFVLTKAEIAAFCVRPPASPGVAPVGEQCYPKLPPIIDLAGATFTPASSLTPWTETAKSEAGPNGEVVVTPSPTNGGYQVFLDLPKSNAVAVSVRYEIDAASAPGTLGILRGDASAWVATASFGPGSSKSGQITGVMDGAGAKLVVESPAGAGPIKFRTLEIARLCETKAAEGWVAATVSNCQ